MDNPTFKPGDLVKDDRGVLRGVAFQLNAVQVFVGCNTWVHPANIRYVGGAFLAENPHYYTADASDLGLEPGRFPREIPTDMGNRKPFVMVSHMMSDDGQIEAVLYRQMHGELELDVIND
jgi:hypothetical protein